MKKVIAFTTILLIAIGLLTACGGNKAEKSIVIGSKDFAEQYIVAEMYAQVLEHNGFTVERKFGLAGTPVAHAALTSGEIDLYPEYTDNQILQLDKSKYNVL